MARFATLQTSPPPFLTLILEIRSRSVRFQFRFLKSEVTGSVSYSDSWNPWHCGALLSGASQLVGNVGFSIILTVF